VIGEPSATRAVTLGYKGRLVFSYQAETSASHSASPEENVIETAVSFWNGVRRWAETENTGKKMFDALDPVLREVHSGSDGLTESMQLRASIRIPLGQTPATVQARIAGLAPAGVQLRFWGGDLPYRADKNTPLVRAFLTAIRAEGLEPAFKVKSGTSDMNVVGPAWDCPIVAYGPGDSSLDHTPNEHLDLNEYRRAIAVLTRTLRLL
jgi:LysW-gamma-L-lysine carboxypeptidase